jgi:hypothetical protein
VTLPLEKRKQILAKVPWITRLKLPTACEGFMGNTSMKHIRGTDEQRAQKPKCRNRAFWVYNHSKRCEFHRGEVERYCMNHLFSRGINGCMYEENRFKKWWNEYKKKEN